MSLRDRGMSRTVPKNISFWLLACALILIAAGCAANPTQPVVPTAPLATHTPPVVNSIPTATSEPTATASPSAVPATPAPSFTPAPALSPTPAPTNTLVPLALPTRLPAKNWKQWPVIPEITNRAREIYRQGALVNDLHAFSKVGDCQGI